MTKRNKEPWEMSENDLVTVVLDISFQIHKKWGPGMLESVYEALLVYHLRKQGFQVEQQKSIPFSDEGVYLDIGFRADVIVEKKLVVELKSVERFSPVFPKIVLTYLRILGLRLGIIINFGEAYLKDGIKRVINGNLN